jgi:hypothetical protein
LSADAIQGEKEEKEKEKEKKKAGEDIKEKSNKGIGYESRQTVDCSRRRRHHNGLHVL